MKTERQHSLLPGNNRSWLILGWFLEHPGQAIHVKGLARELKISSGSASTLLARLHEERFLTRRREANVLLYALNNDRLAVRALKRLHTVLALEKLELAERFLELDDGIISLCLYGSCAAGENYSHSDMDLLLITGSRGLDYGSVLSLAEESFRTEISLMTYSLSDWMELKRTDPGFYETVLANHVVLYGSQLP